MQLHTVESQYVFQRGCCNCLTFHGHKLTENGSSDNFTLYWMIRLKSIFTPEDTKSTIVVSCNNNNAIVDDPPNTLQNFKWVQYIYMWQDIIWYLSFGFFDKFVHIHLKSFNKFCWF